MGISYRFVISSMSLNLFLLGLVDVNVSQLTSARLIVSNNIVKIAKERLLDAEFIYSNYCPYSYEWTLCDTVVLNFIMHRHKLSKTF